LASKGDGETDVSPEVEKTIEGKRGGGQALDSNVRARMESAFGADFSGVRAHTDSGADTLSGRLNARAFTTGKDIFFKQGAYSPGSSIGLELLAHELTHVVQQTGGKRTKLTIGQPGDKYEQEADKVAQTVVQREKKLFSQEDDMKETRRREGGERVQMQELEEEEEELQMAANRMRIQQKTMGIEIGPHQVKVESDLRRMPTGKPRTQGKASSIHKAEQKESVSPKEAMATTDPPWSAELCKKWKEEELKAGVFGFTKKYLEAKYSHCQDVVDNWDTHYGNWEGVLDKDQQWFFWQYGYEIKKNPGLAKQEKWQKNLWERFWSSRRYEPSVREKAKKVL
jgi:hypothetical protein